MPQLVWLVTGTATGFGEQLVHAILDRGDKVIASARKASERLKAQKDAGAATIDLDVTASQSDLDAKVNEAWKIYGKIDVLINNAAYVEAGFLEELGDERTRNVFSTNFFGTMNLTRAILPHFREHRAGTLLFMSSIVAWEAIPTSGAYAATKGSLESAVLCLKDEVAAFGIKTCTLIPGHFRTEILSPQKIVYGARDIPDYAEANKMFEAAVINLHQKQLGDPKGAALRIVDAVRSEGGAAGKELPSILPLGQDAVDVIRKRCRATIETCDEWEAFSSKTTTQNLTMAASRIGILLPVIPYTMFFLLRIGQKCNTTRDPCDITEEQINTALKTQMWYDLAGDPVPHLISALLIFTDKERLMFGSDVPWTPFEVTKALVAKFERELADCVGPDAVESVWRGTAQGLLSGNGEGVPALDLQ